MDMEENEAIKSSHFSIDSKSSQLNIIYTIPLHILLQCIIKFTRNSELGTTIFGHGKEVLLR